MPGIPGIPGAAPTPAPALACEGRADGESCVGGAQEGFFSPVAEEVEAEGALADWEGVPGLVLEAAVPLARTQRCGEICAARTLAYSS